jgi:predicted Zn-dependent peptidase
MVFKGTKSRSAEQIAREVDSIGGNIDAFTAKECVSFSIKVLDEHVPIALDVLSDLVLNPTFDEQDITRERGVILEEIKMDEDNPDYLVHEIFTQNFWKDHPLGRPILGTRDTVRRFERVPVVDFYSQRFASGNVIITAAGYLDHDRFVELVAQHFENMKSMSNGFHNLPPRIVPRIILRNKKALEQVQICVGVPSYPITHEKRHSSYILNTLLGGGMSSRLFQNIRERQGLRDLQRPEPLPRHRMPVGLCRNLAKHRDQGGRVHCLRIPQAESGTGFARGAATFKKPAQRQPDVVA